MRVHINKFLKKSGHKKLNGWLRIAALAFIVAACLALCYLQRPFLAENIENKKIANVVLSIFGEKFHLEEIERNNDKKTLRLTFIEHIENCDPKTFNTIRVALNNYLKEHPDCFINQGYKTEILFTTRGPSLLSFSNVNPSTGNLYSGFYHLRVFDDYLSGPPNYYYFPDLASFTDIEDLEIENPNTDGLDLFCQENYLSTLKKLHSLKYLSRLRGFSDAEENKIKAILPNCKIGIFTNNDF